MDKISAIQTLQDVRINVVAPASSTSSDILNSLRGIKALHAKIPADCFDSSSPFHSASDEKRFQCLKDAIMDDSTEVIWCLRGGYGSAKLIPFLRTLAKPQKPKIFIGYSDITALHLFFSQEWGWRTIHGNSIIDFVQNSKDASSLVKLANIIAGKSKTSKIEGLAPLNSFAQKSSSISGVLTGGNLTIIATSLGTDWQIQSKDKILFLEDTGMRPYQTDRTLNHLKQAGALNGVKAIIFGCFDQDNESVMQGLRLFADSIDIPVFKTNHFGHEKLNDPIIYNAPAVIAPHNHKFNITIKL